MKQLTFTKAIIDTFGRREGQSLADFQAELKVLSIEDRAYFLTQFAKIDIEIVSGIVSGTAPVATAS